MAASAALSRRQRVLRAALRAVHGRFQLERLVRFNEKFFPTWRPRYLVYGRRTHLPLAALRVLQAEAYLRPPRARPLSAGWKPAPGPAATAAAIVRPEASR
jgi:lysyl-tRNA synthetase class 2